VLRILTANLLAGRAAPAELVGLTARKNADLLLVQELTEAAENGLKRAGLGDLLAYRVMPRRRGTAIYSRYPLRDGLAAAAVSAARCSARLDLPSGQSVQVICVHPKPPKPPWRPEATARWHSQLAGLPPPGDCTQILAGDFNATLDHAQFRRLLRLGYLDAASQAGHGLHLTWGPEPHRRPALLAIDHVLADRQCAILATSAHQVTGSDHWAFYAELRLPASRRAT
jgi:endonuclease/exonuclease/phosphatase (EEP) superfamily protein YafD